MFTGNDQQRHLDCPICLEEFSSDERIPKGLRCQHCVCLPCATRMIKGNKIQCPTCRNVEHIENANELFTNHMVLGTVQEQQREMKHDVEKASDRIRNNKAKLENKAASCKEGGSSINKAVERAKQNIAIEISRCANELYDRKGELIALVVSLNLEVEKMEKEAESNCEQATKLQEEQIDLAKKDKINKDEYDRFKKKEAALKMMSEIEDKPVQETALVVFDQQPNISDVIQKFGCLQIPTILVKPPAQLVHIRSIGTHGTGRGQFDGPLGVGVTPKGNLLVADYNNDRVQELDLSGSVIRVIGAEGKRDGCFGGPNDVKADSTGNIYVTDVNNHRIQVFDNEGKFVYQIGKRGSGPGKLRYPTALALDDAQRLIYVADHKNHRVQVFDFTGSYKTQIGNATELNEPYGLCLHGERLFVSCHGSQRIVVYKTDGHKLKVIGRQGSHLGEFNLPCHLTVDPNGQLLVCDRSNHRVQILDGDTGKLIHVLGGEAGDPGQFNGPGGVALTPSGKLVVSEAFGHRIQLFDFQSRP